MIELEDIREAFRSLEDPPSNKEIGRRMGVDEARVRALLRGKRERGVVQRRCHYSTARKLVDALHVDPVDVGL